MKVIINNINKSYGGQKVLNDITMNIEQVSSIGIIGESGCGKSTLLRQLSGIEVPDSGALEINGISPIDEPVRFKEKIGVVFQRHNLFPHLSILENITLILHKIRKGNKEESHEKAMSLLVQLKISEQAHKKPSEVSGGQAQRASIARALATDPDLIFLDEPTAALDPLMTKEVLAAIIDLKEKGREFIFVTHEIEFLKEFADYIIFMDKGQVVEHGHGEILEKPRTEKLKVFLSN